MSTYFVLKKGDRFFAGVNEWKSETDPKFVRTTTCFESAYCFATLEEAKDCSVSPHCIEALRGFKPFKVETVLTEMFFK